MVFLLPEMFGGSYIKGHALTAAIALIASTGFLLFGYDQGVMSGLLTEQAFAVQFPKIGSYGNIQADSNVQGAVVAIYEIGALVGSLIVLWRGDAMGRRLSVVIGAITMIVGAVIMASAYSLGQFTVGRIVTGIGNGMNTSTLPMWQSETTKAHNRGKLVLIEGSLISAGIMISYWIDYGFHFIQGSSVQWRFPIAFQCVFATILLLGILALPESPRWLIKHREVEKARVILARLDNTTVDDPRVQLEAKTLEDSINWQERELSSFSYKELFTCGPEQNFYRASIAVIAQAFQQLSGINLITYYATTVFKSIVPDDNLARLLAAFNGTEYFLASIAALFMIDTFGRRNLMIYTAALMSASMAVLAGTVSAVEANLQPDGTSLAKGSSYAAAVFLFLFNTWFAFGWLGMTWLYPAEITPIRIRAQASAIATSSNWLFNFLIVMITPPSFSNIKYKTYIIFAVLNAAFIPVIYILFPETKRRSLEEMDLIFAEAHQERTKGRGMTSATYLSVTKPYMSADDVEVALRSHFGDKRRPELKEMAVDENSSKDATA